MMEPIRMNPVCKDNLWGGNRLRERYGKRSQADRIAESWDLSAHAAGQSTAADGPFAGKTLTQIAQACGERLLGSNCARFDRFPILIKLIDAAQPLSIQVHPDDSYAMRVEGEPGKTEMWYIVEAEEGAFLYFGFRRDLSREEYARGIADGSVTELLNRVPVRAGDVLMVRAGTVHAIGAGVLLAEIQQNSNTTYRVYDFGRLDKDGNPRELHVEKALDVSDLTGRPALPDRTAPLAQEAGADRDLLGDCDYFHTERCTLHGAAEFGTDGTSFHALNCVHGSVRLTAGDYQTVLAQGDCVLVPADCGRYTLEGTGTVLVTCVPQEAGAGQ